MATETESKTQAQSGIDLDLIKALGHPLRFEALRIFNARVASPTEISQELMVPVNKLAYHVRILEKYGCVELVDTKQRRGATEHFYRAMKRAEFDQDEWVQIPRNLREEISSKTLLGVGREISGAVQSGTIDARDDRPMIWLPLQLDEEGWKQAVAILVEAEEKLTEVTAEAVNRLAESDEKPIQASALLMGFEMPAATSSEDAS
ncbi:MAG TPA: helix-turn-helix domain-containing protein [Solirubrobacterales bacterium]|nr:helix-turn-helix domain-containing protein [Solirubrobacterales bacterium]